MTLGKNLKCYGEYGRDGYLLNPWEFATHRHYKFAWPIAIIIFCDYEFFAQHDGKICFKIFGLAASTIIALNTSLAIQRVLRKVNRDNNLQGE